MCRKSFRKTSRVTCSSSRWSKGGTTSCQNTNNCRKDHKRYQASSTKEEACRKTVPQQTKRSGSSKRSSSKKSSVSDKVDKNKMAGADMAAELKRLQAGEERRGSNASQTGDCCMEALWQQIIVLGTNQAEAMSQRYREMGAIQGQMPGREEGRRNSEDKQEQNKASQQSAGTAKDERKRLLSNFPCRFPMEEEEDASLGTGEGERVEGQGKDPRTFDGNSQGGDLSTPKTDSQGEDPRTFTEPVERWRVQKKRKEKKKQKDKKKKVKYRRSSWWKKAKERIASFFA